MNLVSFNVVYVDRRAHRDRVERRGEHGINEASMASLAISNGTNGVEHHEVDENIRTLLATFTSVNVCTSGSRCLSTLSELDSNPSLVLFDVPTQPQPEEENVSHDGRHDSGIATGPADILYGLPLLKYVCIEMDNNRMSSAIIPVAMLSSEDDDDDDSVADDSMMSTVARSNGISGSELRELQCIDYGAQDVLKSPFSVDRAKALYFTCYRARKKIAKGRKQSWVGFGEPTAPPTELNTYSYLREKMVSELMTEICKPKHARYSPLDGQIQISEIRVHDVKNAIGDWNFSAHEFSDEELVYCAQLMLEHALQMPEVAEYNISSEKLTQFVLACRASYNPTIPYHNFRHVVDVLQAVFFFLLQLRSLPTYNTGRVEEPSEYTHTLSGLIRPIDALTLLVVAIGHDVGHPGVNNQFLVTLKAPLAQVYNDRSVLESFHCAAFSQVLRKYWPKTLELRKPMIDMILATDMGLHFDYMGKLEKLRKKAEKDGLHGWEEKAIIEQRGLLCALLIKCADISNVARNHNCSAQWATILMEEFSRQANIEIDLHIPSSLVAPPVTGSPIALARSQVGFMGLFAIPLFDNLSKVLPEMGFSVRELETNKNSWNQRIEECSEGKTIEDKKSERNSPAPSEKIDIGLIPPHRRGSPQSIATDSSGRHLAPVLGTVMMETDVPRDDVTPTTPMVGTGSFSGAGVISPQLGDSRSSVAVHSNGNATAVTVVVTRPKPSSPSAQTNGFETSLSPPDKTPRYQHSTEHLRETSSSESSAHNRPKSSPPDLGDHSEHSCTKDCCEATTSAVATPTHTIERRSSRFFKRVMLWKTWRREQSDG